MILATFCLSSNFSLRPNKRESGFCLIKRRVITYAIWCHLRNIKYSIFVGISFTILKSAHFIEHLIPYSILYNSRVMLFRVVVMCCSYMSWNTANETAAMSMNSQCECTPGGDGRASWIFLLKSVGRPWTTIHFGVILEILGWDFQWNWRSKWLWNTRSRKATQLPNN